MNLITWTSALELGNSLIEQSHREIIEALKQLRVAQGAEFGVRLFALIERMERDFRYEEELMGSIGYPDSGCHLEQHARALQALHHVVPAAMKGDYAPALEVVSLLPSWFLFHSSTMDMMLCIAAGMATPALHRPSCRRAVEPVVRPHGREGEPADGIGFFSSGTMQIGASRRRASRAGRHVRLSVDMNRAR